LVRRPSALSTLFPYTTLFRSRAWKPDGGSEKWFCGDCGSALYSRVPGDPDRLGVRLGALDAPPGITPSAHQYVAYAASWEQIPEDRKSTRLNSSHLGISYAVF